MRGNPQLLRKAPHQAVGIHPSQGDQFVQEDVLLKVLFEAERTTPISEERKPSFQKEIGR